MFVSPVAAASDDDSDDNDEDDHHHHHDGDDDDDDHHAACHCRCNYYCPTGYQSFAGAPKVQGSTASLVPGSHKPQIRNPVP